MSWKPVRSGSLCLTSEEKNHLENRWALEENGESAKRIYMHYWFCLAKNSEGLAYADAVRHAERWALRTALVNHPTGLSYMTTSALSPVGFFEADSIQPSLGDLAEARYWLRQLVKAKPEDIEVKKKLLSIEEDINRRRN